MRVGFALFFIIYFGKNVGAIIITRSTIQGIKYDGSVFRGKTFSGKTFEIDWTSELLENESFFSKKNRGFLFGESNRNIIIRFDSGSYYFSGSMEGINNSR